MPARGKSREPWSTRKPRNNATPEELRERIAQLDDGRKAQLIARMQAEKELRRTLWECDIPVCAGTPHQKAPAKHARANQRLPFKRDDGLVIALYMAGRGFGKTRLGAEAVRKRVNKGLAGRVGLIARTAADARDVMIEGESGLLSVFPRWQRPEYLPSKREIRFHNGAIAKVYSAEEPDMLRGPQHDFLWGDEVSTWKKLLAVKVETQKPSPEGVLTNALLGLRLPVRGDMPRAVLTGTPRPTRDMKYLVNKMPGVHIRTGTTYENLGNLAEVFKTTILDQYEGTRVGRQELLGELLKDVEGALLSWDYFELDDFRLWEPLTMLSTVVVAVDPAVTSESKSDHTGIAVVAVDEDRRHGYVLHSERFKGTPQAAMQRVANLYDTHMASHVVAETNNGGDYVVTTMKLIRDDIKVKKVHASVGKTARAEPVAALYEQARIHHIGGPSTHAALEDEWTTWIPNEKDQESPDVMDAVVWGFHDLMIGKGQRVVPPAKNLPR